MRPIQYISLFSGIEAATVAWHPLGWQPAAFAEIDKFCCELLAHYYPDVPNLGDITQITQDQVEALGNIDVVVFGSPCQDLSVAGQRGGLKDGTRSNLFFAGVQVARWSQARFALWENVPGAFSSNHGDDFGTVVGSLVGLAGVPVPSCRWRNEGAAVGPLGMLEWSVLDAQFFGVAQRRRRVFALLDTGDWSNRPPILLEPHGLRGDPPARGEARQEVAGTLGGGSCQQGPRTDTDRMTFLPVAGTLQASGKAAGSATQQDVEAGMLIPELAEPIATSEARTYTHEGNMYRLRNCVPDVAPSVTSKMAKGTGGPAGDECQNLIVANSLQASDGDHGHRSPRGDGSDNLVVFDSTQVTHPENRSNPQPGAPCHTLAKGQAAPCVATRMAIRRLTPVECERLQGFPDNYTLVPRGKKHKPAADGPRYRAIGNSFAVPVVRWIGQRIQAVLDGSAK